MPATIRGAIYNTPQICKWVNFGQAGKLTGITSVFDLFDTCAFAEFSTTQLERDKNSR